MKRGKSNDAHQCVLGAVIGAVLATAAHSHYRTVRYIRVYTFVLNSVFAPPSVLRSASIRLPISVCAAANYVYVVAA